MHYLSKSLMQKTLFVITAVNLPEQWKYNIVLGLQRIIHRLLLIHTVGSGEKLDSYQDKDF